MPKIRQYADQAAQNLGGLRLDLQFFADPNGGDGGLNGGQTPNDPQTPPNNQPNEQDPNNQQPNGQQQDDEFLPQSEVNRIVARERRKAQEKLLKELGIEDFENAKEGLQKFREWQESQKTEAQKQAERLQQLEQQFNAVQQEKETLLAQLAAVKAGVHADFVEDVIVLAQRLVNEDTTIDEAIQKVIEKYPHFKEAQQQQDEPPKPQFSAGQHQKTSADDFIKALLGK
jgi:hypothetical protein